MALDWSDLEDAIRQWVISSTPPELDREHVIFANQEGGVPPGPFIVIFVGDSVPVGRATVTTWYNAGAPPSEEIEIQARQIHLVSVTIQAFTPDTIGDAVARSYLSTIESRLHLPGVRAALRASGLVPIEVGSIQYLPAIAGTDFEGRGILDVRFYVEQSATERTTFIEQVEALPAVGGDLDL